MGDRANPRIELWVLGALLDAEGSVLKSRASDLIAAGGLTADDFTSPERRAVFQAIRSLAERGREANAQSVFALCSQIEFENLRSLQSGNTASKSTFLEHAEEVRRLGLVRRLEAFHSAQLKALDVPRANPATLTAAVESFAQSFAASVQVDETGDADMFELLEDWDAAQKGIREPLVATGVEMLDEVIGGFVPNLNAIGGLPSVGKSALIGEIILACLERGLKVGLFGLEDATKWLTKRHLARALNMPVRDVGVVALHEYQQEALLAAAERLTNLTKNLVVYRRAGIDPETLVAKCKSWVLNKGVQLVLIDHGGEVQHQGKQRDRYDLAVAETYRALRDFAVNARVPVVVLAHFNRETAKEGGVPTMQSFAETEYIARMARLALGLWERPGDERLRCTVLKATEGEKGITVALERDRRAALVKRKDGEVLDLRAEAEAAAAAKADKRKSKGAGAWTSAS